MIVGPDGGLRAVLDWELATLGDTLADVGWLLSSWLEPGERTASPFAPPTTAAGFPTRAELAERYARDVRPRPLRPAVLRGVQPVALGVHRRGSAGPLQARP